MQMPTAHRQELKTTSELCRIISQLGSLSTMQHVSDTIILCRLTPCNKLFMAANDFIYSTLFAHNMQHKILWKKISHIYSQTQFNT